MRRLLLLAPALLLAACGPDPYTDTPVPLAACVAPVEGDAAVPPTLAAEVVEVDVGPGCFASRGLGAEPERFDPAEARRLLVEADDGTRFEVGLLMPRSTLPLAAGDRVFVEWQLREDGTGRFALGYEEGDLLAWVGRAGSLAGLAALGLPEGLALSEGAVVHSEEAECGAWEALDLDVTWSGVDFTLPYGGQTRLDTVLFSHGGFSRDAGEGSGCATDDVLVGVGLWGG